MLALLGVGGAERYRQVKARSGPLSANGSDHPALNNTPLQWACFHGHINVSITQALGYHTCTCAFTCFSTIPARLECPRVHAHALIFQSMRPYSGLLI